MRSTEATSTRLQKDGRRDDQPKPFMQTIVTHARSQDILQVIKNGPFSKKAKKTKKYLFFFYFTTETEEASSCGLDGDGGGVQRSTMVAIAFFRRDDLRL